MAQNKKEKKSSIIDKYKGVKQDSVTAILTDKNGQKTIIKL